MSGRRKDEITDGGQTERPVDGVRGIPSLDRTEVIPLPQAESLVPGRSEGRSRRAPSEEAPHAGAGPEPKALRIVREGSEDLVVPLYSDRSYVFGRAPQCNVVFPHDAVSRQHGRLSVREDGRWVYRDLGSRNGTFLVHGPVAGSEDPRAGALRLNPGRDHALIGGDTLLLGNGRSCLVLLDELPAGLVAGGQRPGAHSRASRELEAAVEVCAHHRLPVFLIGASGSGKTHVARRIHERSRMQGSFIIINCGRLPTDPSQLTSELLGHVKGAYTGANLDRLGKLRAADGGTLFLDEVEFLPRVAQDFLIDVLDGTGSFTPLGAPPDDRAPPPHFRLIAASKRPLAQSGLRPDLCLRLTAADIIPLPTLEERREDIPALVEEFLHQLRLEQAIRAELTPDAIALLQQRRWPGQIRELESTVKVVVAREHAHLRIDGIDGEEDRDLIIGADAVRAHLEKRQLGFDGHPDDSPVGEPAELSASAARKRPADLSAQDIAQALERHGGNKTRAAKELGIAVNTLKALMRRPASKPE